MFFIANLGFEYKSATTYSNHNPSYYNHYSFQNNTVKWYNLQNYPRSTNGIAES